MNESLYTVGQVFKLQLLMGKKGPLKTKVEVLRTIRTLKHEIVRINKQRAYAVPLSEILRHNARRARKVHIPLLPEDESDSRNEG